MQWILTFAFLTFSFAHAAEAFRYEDLVSLIQSHHLTRLEDILPLLPEDLRSSYTLMRQSRSLQFADPLNPRVILYGRDASLTCAFSGGEAGKAGSDSLECFQFQPETDSFDFRQIVFSGKDVRFSKRGQSADGRIACSSCHGADPRPNWDEYKFWPGAYGENYDVVPGDSQEGQDYIRFLARRALHPRYRWLIRKPDASDYSTNYSNLRFSDLVNSMNARRAARLLQAGVKRWQALGFAVRALGCTPTHAQRATYQQAGLHYDRDTDPLAIFDLLHISGSEWSTRVNGDRANGLIYDHEGGFGLLRLEVAMRMAQELADAGNENLAHGIAHIIASYRDTQYLDGLFAALNAYVPDPGYLFNRKTYEGNINAICPEMMRAFTDAYLRIGIPGAAQCLRAEATAF